MFKNAVVNTLGSQQNIELLNSVCIFVNRRPATFYVSSADRVLGMTEDNQLVYEHFVVLILHPLIRIGS